MEHTKERNFVIHLLKLFLGRTDKLYTELEDLDWSAVLQIARFNKIRPSIYHVLAKYYTEFTNTEVVRLKMEVLGITAFNLQQLTELSALIKLLKDNNIEIIPYKGLVLSKAAFNGFGMREFSDIDFLFQKKDFHQVKRLLLEKGYQTEKKIPRTFEKVYLYHHCEYNFLFKEHNQRKFFVEPHWFLGTRMLQNNISFKQVKQLTATGTLSSADATNLLGPEGLLLTTCIHHTSIRYPTFKSIMDVATLLARYADEIDWKKILAVSKEWGIQNILLFSIHLASTELEAPLPEKVKVLVGEKLSSQLLSNYKKHVLDTGVKPFTVKYHYKRIRLQFLLRDSLYTKSKILWFTFLYYATFKVFFRNKEI
ncbi:nucleotidyltransferase family protein [uncultured Arcticibacterium sp.]|uniref:nucleotidyltransferase domain-containing protein n=1 Tax=uncultured Arcticibacterium sp. TaxID=2173042 RepID=UPI0030F9F2ED